MIWEIIKVETLSLKLKENKYKNLLNLLKRIRMV